jgi:hypothetical protein
MATSRAAYAAEQAIGHEKENLKQDVSNYQQVGDQHETMKALIWQGKQKVEVGTSPSGPGRAQAIADSTRLQQLTSQNHGSWKTAM